MSQLPASIRFNNPGAQYPGPSARKFGSVGTEIIGGGHKIAVFDDPVNGAAAQFDLLNRGYTGMTVKDAIKKWSGGNFSQPYAEYLAKKVPGLTLDTVITPDLLKNPDFAVPFVKASASWETGREYPLADEQWRAAHSMAFNGAPAADPRNVAMNGKAFGVDPDGFAGVAGPIQTATPTDAGVVSPQSGPAPAQPDIGGSMLASLFGGGGDFSSLMSSQSDTSKAMLSKVMSGSESELNLSTKKVGTPNVDIASLMKILKGRSQLGTA